MYQLTSMKKNVLKRETPLFCEDERNGIKKYKKSLY